MEKRFYPGPPVEPCQISATTGYGWVALGSWRDLLRALLVPEELKTAVGGNEQLILTEVCNGSNVHRPGHPTGFYLQ